VNDSIYFPIENGVYSVAPGLKNLGNEKIFQITQQFQAARENKLLARDERLSKYFCEKDFSLERKKTLAQFLIHRFVMEYPEVFSFHDKALKCNHTGDEIHIDDDFSLTHFVSSEEILPKVTDIMDALALQVEEDLALVCKDSGRDFLALLHLCSPSHWAAEDKIGMNFFDVHAPIPGIEKVNRMADRLVETMIEKGPYTRYIWSFVTDKRLNHHPEAPKGVDPLVWKGRSFDKSQEIPFYLRIERQVTFGFKSEQMSLFTIGISFLSGVEIKNNHHQRQELISALKSMTAESRVYKGVDHCFNELLNWLESD
jgi:dimethylamine monooxygenase subunit A